MKRRNGGFTIIELLIVLVVMVILLTLAVVNLRSSEAKARDHERTTDMEGMATLLETYYTVRSSEATGSGQGEYPPTIAFASEATLRTYLPDVNAQLLRAPNVDSGATMSIVPATNATVNAYNVTPRPTLQSYVYQPLQANGSLCTTVAQTCSTYSLYYAKEIGSSDCIGTNNRYCTQEDKR